MPKRRSKAEAKEKLRPKRRRRSKKNEKYAHGLGRRPTYRDAMETPEKESWLQAIQERYEAIIQNKTFEDAEAKAPAKAISSKWVFKRKHKPDGSIRCKARLVIRDFEQTDYRETYAPAGKPTNHLPVRDHRSGAAFLAI